MKCGNQPVPALPEPRGMAGRRKLTPDEMDDCSRQFLHLSRHTPFVHIGRQAAPSAPGVTNPPLPKRLAKRPASTRPIPPPHRKGYFLRAQSLNERGKSRPTREAFGVMMNEIYRLWGHTTYLPSQHRMNHDRPVLSIPHHASYDDKITYHRLARCATY